MAIFVLWRETGVNTPDVARVFGNELKYVKEVLDTELRSSRGSIMMRRLEEAFASRFGSRYAISHVNGTATLHSLLEAAGIGAGDEVIVPPLTMSSTTFAVLQANATPVFADIDPETFQIRADSIEQCRTTKTRAIITVALFGLAPDMDPIMDLARKHKLFVIEDSAQCVLGEYKGRIVGTIGHGGSFSFQSSKHITSGEGGMVVTDDPEVAGRVRKICSLGYAGVSASKGKITKKDIQDPDYSRHVSMGWNYRISELCAAVALAQLENIDALVERRIHSAELLREAVRQCEWLIPQKTPTGCKNSYWTCALRLNHPKVTWRMFRDRFMELGGDGIYAAWKLSYLEPMFQSRSLLGREKFISSETLNSYRKGLCPAAESIQPQLLQLKTNYWNPVQAERQAEILKKTVESI